MSFYIGFGIMIAVDVVAIAWGFIHVWNMLHK